MEDKLIAKGRDSDGDIMMAEGRNDIKVEPFQCRKDLPCFCQTDKASGILFGQSAVECPEEYSSLVERYGKEGQPGLYINVASKRKPCQIKIVCNDEEIPEKLTGFDKAVLEAICSLVESGCLGITAKQVLETISGRNIKRKDDSKILLQIKASIEKMRGIKIDLDWSEQAVKLGLLKKGSAPNNKFIINENILLADGVFLKMQNGLMVDGYSIIRMPGLYRYAKAIGQVTSLAPEFLNVQGLETSKLNIELTFYIAQRIMQLANSKNARKHKISNVIILDTMFKHCEAKIDSRTELKRVRDTVYKILDHYKSAGLIMDYAKITERQSVTKVEIVMPEKGRPGN